jgi:GT2 family glycosyltransferase
MNDLAVIIVSYGSAQWLPTCLETLYAHAGDIALDVIVADNDPGDEVPGIVERHPPTRLIPCENRGFAAGNNAGLTAADARYILFLNPDTEIRSGTLADLLRRLDARPAIGAIGVRQVLPTGELFPTIRRFPGVLHALAEGLGVERLRQPKLPLGERVLDLSLYDSELPCDWTSGSFLLVRREALAGAGIFDERFFMFSEEVDLCLRIRRAGWEIWHFPHLEILHYSNKTGVDPRFEAQRALARGLYARKHFPPLKRVAFVGALALRHGLRGALAPLDPENADAWRETARRALPLLLGRGEPPFGPPPPVAVVPPAEERTEGATRA